MKFKTRTIAIHWGVCLPKVTVSTFPCQDKTVKAYFSTSFTSYKICFHNPVPELPGPCLLLSNWKVLHSISIVNDAHIVLCEIIVAHVNADVVLQCACGCEHLGPGKVITLESEVEDGKSSLPVPNDLLYLCIQEVEMPWAHRQSPPVRFLVFGL